MKTKTEPRTRPEKAARPVRSKDDRTSPACVGIFSSFSAATEGVRRLRASGVKDEAISVFSPGTSRKELSAAIPTSDTEQGGMGPALAGSILGALGLGMGVLLFVPGLGPVSVLGAIAAGLMGAGGAAAGATVGAMLERKSLEGLLPVDDLYLYEDALAQGRTVVVVVPPAELERLTAEALVAAGAESIDAARENWWVGIRDGRKLTYESPERKALWDDPACREGFELGYRQRLRGVDQEAGRREVEDEVPPAGRTDAFWLGYAEGRAYSRDEPRST